MIRVLTIRTNGHPNVCGPRTVTHEGSPNKLLWLKAPHSKCVDGRPDPFCSVPTSVDWYWENRPHVPFRPVARGYHASGGRVPPGFGRKRLRRGPERGDRIQVGARSGGPAAIGKPQQWARQVCFFRRFAAAIRFPSRLMRSRVCSCTLPRVARGP
jgi:hypothetical protein